ncbi:MAG: sodium:proton antiporter [bacterium]
MRRATMKPTPMFRSPAIIVPLIALPLLITLCGASSWSPSRRAEAAAVRTGSEVHSAPGQPGEIGAGDRGTGTVEKHTAHEENEGHGESHAAPGGHVVAVPAWGVLPFVGILLSIAVIPLINPKWWHHHFPKVSFLWGCPVAIWVVTLNYHWLIHTAVEYASFIALLSALFTISGGILLRGTLRGTPAVNACIIAIGSVLASLIGTTGAAMVLIRPMLRANKHRKYQMHIILFFIFLVCNIGGSLTPLGDPPLFLGFLRGVPFTWTLNLLPMWAFAVSILLALFFVVDSYFARREAADAPAAEHAHKDPLKIVGAVNFLFLCGVLGTVILYSQLPHELGFRRDFIQVALMATMAGLSLKFTPWKIREENGFTWFPIKEVAILFAGIFSCMIPALQLLEQRGAELGVTKPWQFFWATGAISSFLDNAPTYLTFVSLGKAIHMPEGTPIVKLIEGFIYHPLLLGIAVGAVFMGSNTYIGNAPNFMVKSIAEENNIKMPSFFGYLGYAVLILFPIYIAVTFIFFRP